MNKIKTITRHAIDIIFFNCKNQSTESPGVEAL